MKVVEAGHSYLLANFEHPQEMQSLQFINKTKSKTTGKFATVYDGTTNEEVLEMLIDRMHYLNGLMHSPNNDKAIGALKLALEFLNKRTKDRVARGVEGTDKV